MMTTDERMAVQTFLTAALRRHGDDAPFDETTSLFISGRLDSFSMMTLVVFLEEKFRIDFSCLTFEVELIDSISSIESLVNSHRGCA